MSARLPVVTLDGPAGVGKTTLARRVAEGLGLSYLDTGAMFRCMALKLGAGAETLPEEELRTRCAEWPFTLSGLGQPSPLFCHGVCVRGEVRPGEFGLHLGGAEELTRPVLRMLALEWERLREENAPLRAVVNGRVMGVSEDFYDPVLRRCLTEKPQKVANVLGQALVQLSGVGDWLLARRLRAMVEAGTVRVDEAGSTRGFYGAAVCLA